jgi:Protein of unknown function (DUF2950)
MRYHHDPQRRSPLAAVASAAMALLVMGPAPSCLAQQPGQQSFPSAEAASSALASAVQSHDGTAVMTILGAGQELIHEDDVEDRLLHERFVGKYQQMHRLVREPDGTTVLYIGAENWPFPVPLVSANGAWHFDAQAGLMEVLFRRIGENEAMAIQVCHALVTADRQDSSRSNGADANGALLAKARSGANPTPYYGYHFRILTPPGQNGAGDAKGKVAAVVAYPAEYRSSGVMTFMAGPGDAVYEKDLGANTAEVAGALTAYNPDPSWKLVSQEP